MASSFNEVIAQSKKSILQQEKERAAYELGKMRAFTGYTTLVSGYYGTVTTTTTGTYDASTLSKFFAPATTPPPRLEAEPPPADSETMNVLSELEGRLISLEEKVDKILNLLEANAEGAGVLRVVAP